MIDLILMKDIQIFLAIFHHILTFMPIYVYSFFMRHRFKSQMVKPAYSCAKRNGTREVWWQMLTGQ